MREINTQDAVGHVLCHDMTQIIPGVSKGARFRKGHVVTEEDIPVLLSMGKERLFVWEREPGMLHEDEAAERLRSLCQGENIRATEPKEGKIELLADTDGLFLVDVPRLDAVNEIDEVMIATRHTNTPVRRGDKLAGTRVIPLVIREEKLAQAERVCAGEPLLRVLPYRTRTAGLVVTGSEVASGLVTDAFSGVIEQKLSAYGIRVTEKHMPGDDRAAITAAAIAIHGSGADMVLCCGGMSVDPDDRTPGAIRDTGAEIVSYGAPVLPGAMFLLGYFSDGVPILGLPGCAMYAATTVFDLVLPRLAAGQRVTAGELKRMGHGGLCLSCPECRYPDCAFGKGC